MFEGWGAIQFGGCSLRNNTLRSLRETNQGGRGAHHYQMHVFFRALLKLANPPVLALLLPSIIRAKHCFLRPKKEDQVARIGGSKYSFLWEIVP